MKNIEEEITKTLGSIDNIQTVPSNPFLYAKIKHRMNPLNSPAQHTWMAYAKVAIYVVIVGFNVATIGKVYYNNSKPTMSKEEFGAYLGITQTQNLYEP